MSKIALVSVVVLAWSASAAELSNWLKSADSTQRGYIETEVRGAKILLDAGVPSVLCGYRTPSTWATQSIRMMLLSLKEQVNAELAVSEPHVGQNDSTVCVTVSKR